MDVADISSPSSKNKYGLLPIYKIVKVDEKTQLYSTLELVSDYILPINKDNIKNKKYVNLEISDKRKGEQPSLDDSTDSITNEFASVDYIIHGSSIPSLDIHNTEHVKIYNMLCLSAMSCDCTIHEVKDYKNLCKTHILYTDINRAIKNMHDMLCGYYRTNRLKFISVVETKDDTDNKQNSCIISQIFIRQMVALKSVVSHMIVYPYIRVTIASTEYIMYLDFPILDAKYTDPHNRSVQIDIKKLFDKFLKN